jgi:hypothetical protein
VAGSVRDQASAAGCPQVRTPPREGAQPSPGSATVPVVVAAVDPASVRCRSQAAMPDVGDQEGQRRSSRITTRGKPPETESVSAALVKPASSKSLRVPT